jgi:hypothetical protein
MLFGTIQLPKKNARFKCFFVTKKKVIILNYL